MKRPVPELHRLAWSTAPWRHKWVWRWACPLPRSAHGEGPVAGHARTKTLAVAEYAKHYKAAHPPAPRPRKAAQYARMEPRVGASLADAKVWLRANVDEGAYCPCCSQLAKVYRRQIHAAMASKLVRFWRAYGTEWGQSTAIFRGGRAGARDAGGDFAKLRYWSLVEESEETRGDGGRAGWWRVTPAGQAYVKGELRVRQYALIFDGRRLRWDGQTRSIQDALGTRFDLAELMGRPL